VFLGQLRPAVDDVAVILWRRGQTSGVVDTVMIEEDAEDLVALRQHRLGKLIGGVGRLVRVGTFANQN